MTADMDLITLIERFPDEDSCRRVLEALRWPDGVACVRCGSMSVWDIQKRNQYQCKDCDYRFSVTAGTIMNDSHLPLRKWFLATYLIVEAKKGISSRQLGRTLKVARKTEWYLSHRIREAMAQAMAKDAPLSGTVEVDETYIGGRVRGKGRGYVGNKTIVVGAKQRGGSIKMQVVDANDRATLHRFIKDVAGDAENIYTDEWAAYRGIGDADTRHETVNHRAEEWVRGPVHTNSIEGTWSLFNRALIGSYHQVQRKHLDKYLNEMEWRQNNRENKHLFRDTLKALLSAEAMTYSDLTASTPPIGTA
ncbi:MAG: IS1595 family transposase [Nitrospira sp.]